MRFPCPFPLVLRCCLQVILVFWMTGTAGAQDRWALVLGVSRYDSPQIAPLQNTLNDARTIAAALNTMGFKVYYLENATRREVDQAMDKIAQEQAEADVGVFYFAGHAVQLDGRNWRCPRTSGPTGASLAGTGRSRSTIWWRG